MGIPKFPKATPLITAITTNEAGLVTAEQIVSIHRSWPHEADLDELLR